MARTVADQFADILVAAGVKRIYGMVGDSLNGLTDALRRQGKIEWSHARHEEVAAFYRQFYPRGRGAKIAQVDVRGEVIGRRVPVDLGVVGDVRATIEALLPRLKAQATLAISTRRAGTTRRPARISTRSRSAAAASRRSIPSRWRRRSATMRATTRYRTRSEAAVLNRNSAHRDLQTARPHRKSEG